MKNLSSLMATIILLCFTSCGNEPDAISDTALQSDSISGDTLFLTFTHEMSTESYDKTAQELIIQKTLYLGSDKFTLMYLLPQGIQSSVKPVFVQDKLQRMTLHPFDRWKKGNTSSMDYYLSDSASEVVLGLYKSKYGSGDTTSISKEVSANLSGTKTATVVTYFTEWELTTKKISISVYKGTEEEHGMIIYYLPKTSSFPSEWLREEYRLEDSTRKADQQKNLNEI